MDKYQALRKALPVLVAEARRAGGENPRAKMIIDLLADYDRLRGQRGVLADMLEQAIGYCRMVDLDETCSIGAEDALELLIINVEKAVAAVRAEQIGRST